MTASEFADLVRGRTSGHSKWQAKCPAHDDHSPSLSICEGARGRVLVRCWAGCSIDSVLAALGLRTSDLFAGPTPTPRQAATLAAERQSRIATQRQQCEAGHVARDRAWNLEQVMNVLGAKLMLQPDDSEMGKLFHVTLDQLCEAEISSTQIGPELGGLRLEAPPEVSAWIAHALATIGQSFGIESNPARREPTA